MSIDWLPAKKIKPTEIGNRGIIPTTKAVLGFIVYASCLERDLYILCIHDPNVKRIVHQPVTIHYKDKTGKARIYTPDARIEYLDGKQELIEVKYESEVENKRAKFNERWKAAEKWASEHGMEFKVLTEQNIRTPRRENVWFTLGASKCVSNDQYIDKLSAIIPETGTEYNALCFQLSDEFNVTLSKAAQIVCYAIYHGLIIVNNFSKKQIAKDTIIRKRKKTDITIFKPLYQDLWSSENDDETQINSEPVINTSIKSLDTNNPEKYEETVNKREMAVKEWLKQPSRNRTVEWRDEFCKRFGIPQRTIYRWVEAYEKSNIDGLVPKHEKKGRQKQFDSLTLEKIELARKHYLQPNEKLKTAYEKLDKLCAVEGLQTPTFAAFKWYIYQNTTGAEFAEKRGRKYYKSHFKSSLASFQGAIMPMQVLEIDNSELDVLQVDSEERELLKAPDLTSAIDNYSRMIAGTEISFFSCSSRSVLEVLVQSILPKDNYCQTYNTDQEWPIQGFPVVILVDNGMDFRSKAVQEFCRKYDIIIEYVPLRNPQYKAFIEQWFNVLHKALESEEVPGTRPILRKRLENPDLKPEADAVFTLQESETWLYKWIINEYHFDNSYDDHVLAPYLKLVDAQEGRTPLILPLPREPPTNKREIELLHLATLTTESRQLGAAGVVWEHLKYNNEELALLFKRVGEKQEVKILLDTRDIRNIWVVDPITEKPIKVGLASGWAQKIANIYGDTPINASAWKKQVAQIKEITKERITPFLYGKMESKLQRKELIKSSKKTTKFIRKEREQQKEAIRKGIINKVLDNKDSDSIITNFTQSKEIEIESNQTNEFQQIDWSKIVPTGKRTRKAY